MRLWLVVALIGVTISPLFIMRLVALDNIEAQLRYHVSAPISILLRKDFL